MSGIVIYRLDHQRVDLLVALANLHVLFVQRMDQSSGAESLRYDSIPWRKKTTLKLVPFDNLANYPWGAEANVPKARRTECFSNFDAGKTMIQ